MNEDDKIISSGLFKGKKIKFAPTKGIDMFKVHLAVIEKTELIDIMVTRFDYLVNI